MDALWADSSSAFAARLGRRFSPLLNDLLAVRGVLLRANIAVVQTHAPGDRDQESMRTENIKMGSEMRSLTDILDSNVLVEAWDETQAAVEFDPLPTGIYVARIVAGKLSNSRGGTPGYKLTFEVIEGECKGRRVWHDVWLTEAALPLAKRDLAKLGITSLDQLERPLPQGIRCEIKVALRKEESGIEFNRVRSFTVLGIDPVEQDAFAPMEVL